MRIFNIKDKCPDSGYILKKWNKIGYRATAIAYLQRENLNTIEHTNSKWYNLSQLKNSLIN